MKVTKYSISPLETTSIGHTCNFVLHPWYSSPTEMIPQEFSILRTFQSTCRTKIVESSLPQQQTCEQVFKTRTNYAIVTENSNFLFLRGKGGNEIHLSSYTWAEHSHCVKYSICFSTSNFGFTFEISLLHSSNDASIQLLESIPTRIPGFCRLDTYSILERTRFKESPKIVFISVGNLTQYVIPPRRLGNKKTKRQVRAESEK